jgi:hypothetical protein
MTQTNETRREIVRHAARWAANMLVEVVGNHGSVLNEGERTALKMAVHALTITFAMSAPEPAALEGPEGPPTSGLDLRPRPTVAPTKPAFVEPAYADPLGGVHGPTGEDLPAPSFDEQLQRWLSEAQAMINEHFAHKLPNLTPNSLSIDPGGRKYIRIVTSRGIGDRSVYCFIERETGNVFKSESWKKPAKHARGNISEHASKSVTEYGANYMR